MHTSSKVAPLYTNAAPAQQVNHRLKVYPPKPQKVYFFATCLVDLFYPEAGMAGIQLLEQQGIEVLYPPTQTCCGQPAYTSGYHDQARAVAQAQLDLFPEPWPIVLPSGSCAGMMRQHYPQLFAHTPEQARAQAIANRVFELTDFLLHVCQVQLKDQGQPIQVALHTSCSARRELGIAHVGEKLLDQLDQVVRVEPKRTSECCGFGGTFAVRHAPISAAMVEDKTLALLDAAPHFVTTDCGCLMNIQGHAEKSRLKLQGEHILSFLWRRTQNDA